MSWRVIMPLAELPEGQVREAKVGDDALALCRVGAREIYALENACSHDSAPLGVGRLEGAEVRCPRHGARFDVRDGRALCMPAVAPIETFPARINDDGQIEVELEEDP